MRCWSLLLAIVLLAASCGSSAGEGAPADTGTTVGEVRYPEVIAAVAEMGADGSWTFHVTLSSPYDSPERYADAWRVRTPEGDDLGVRELAHHHAQEQPFTRSLSGVTIPASVAQVEVQGRDLRNGWGGDTVWVELRRN